MKRKRFGIPVPPFSENLLLALAIVVVAYILIFR